MYIMYMYMCVWGEINSIIPISLENPDKYKRIKYFIGVRENHTAEIT